MSYLLAIGDFLCRLTYGECMDEVRVFVDLSSLEF